MFCHILKICNQFYSKSHVNLIGAKYMHLYKRTCILKHLKSFIWIRYKMSFLDKSFTKSDLSYDIIRLNIWCLMWGKGPPKKCGRTRILQKSPMTIIGKYLYHCWWGMEWAFSLLLLTFLSTALSKRIFSPYSAAELSLRKQSLLWNCRLLLS